MVEVFACPQCGGENCVTWGPKEATREIACVHHYGETRIPQSMKDGAGGDIIVDLVVPTGFYFTAVRGKGLRGVERTRQEGKSWVEGRVVAVGKVEV